MDPSDSTRYAWWEWLLFFVVGLLGIASLGCQWLAQRFIRIAFNETFSARVCNALAVAAVVSLAFWLWRARW